MTYSADTPSMQPAPRSPVPVEQALARAREFAEDLSSRRTVRHFDDRPIPDGVIEQAVRVAGTAPSGANLQPWRFVVEDAAIVMDRLQEVTPDGQTFSAGLAQWTGEESGRQLTARVDTALYGAKRDGRDQFFVGGHPAHTDQHTDFVGSAPTFAR